jgi:hypothetical protein
VNRIAVVARLAAASVVLVTLLAVELAAQLPTPVPRAPTGQPPRGTVFPGVVAPPAPKGVAVTGTPASATVTWQSVPGVASYVVMRRLDNTTFKQAKLAATETRWIDIGIRPSTTYTYVVDAIYPDGRDAYTEVPFDSPPAVNPSGLTALQTGDGQVKLAWQPVSGVSYYLVFGPGSSFGGVKVGVTGSPSYAVTGAPSGPQVWNVASYYDPDPPSASGSVGPNAMSTPAAQFPIVRLTVTAPVVRAPPPPPGKAAAVYQVVATGFRVNHETLDDLLSRDGKGDEVYAAFMISQFNRKTGGQVGNVLAAATLVHGDVNNQVGRIQAGTASSAGGLKSGDTFPVGDPSLRYGRPVSGETFPFLVWRGPLVATQDAVIILSTMWEDDGIPDVLLGDPFIRWQQDEVSAMPRTWSDVAVQQALTATRLALVTPTSGGASMVFALRNDRPIGLQRSVPLMTLPRWAIVLTREMLESAFASAGGASTVKMEIPFVDAPGPDLQGSYVLYIEVERLP